MQILGIIPARYASTRFPAKALHMIEGKSMVQRVYEQATQASSLKEVVIATDHLAIYNHVKDFGGQVLMTSEQHPSGTDRCMEALQKIGKDTYDYVINIQGDEPFIQPAQIDTLAQVLANRSVEIATLMKKIHAPEDLSDLNKVKITFNTQYEALYFSRQAIPAVRQVVPEAWLQHADFYKHIGMYAYRKDILEKITALSPSRLEQLECLEQLRWLENGFKIKLAITELDSFCIDVPEDLTHIALKKFLN